jgi:hypothetical protein
VLICVASFYFSLCSMCLFIRILLFVFLIFFKSFFRNVFCFVSRVFSNLSFWNKKCRTLKSMRKRSTTGNLYECVSWSGLKSGLWSLVWCKVLILSLERRPQKPATDKNLLPHREGGSPLKKVKKITYASFWLQCQMHSVLGNARLLCLHCCA